MNKSQITRSFTRAVSSYDDHARIQRIAVDMIYDHLRQSTNDGVMNVLEIGCGTGLLTTRLFPLFQNASWLVSDLSPEMLDKCQAKFDCNNISFEVLDGEAIENIGQQDLIISSLAFQWFDDLASSLKNIVGFLKPGGRLFFTTLGNQSFMEWKKFLKDQGLNDGMHDYPSFADVKNIILTDASLHGESIIVKDNYDTIFDFLKSLKYIGAHSPRSNYQPIPFKTFKKALSDFDKLYKCSISYEIMFFEIIKK